MRGSHRGGKEMMSVRGRAALGVAAAVTIGMIMLGRVPESRNEISVNPHYGISMERYQAEMAAVLREEEELTRASVRREILSLSEESQTMLMKIAMAEAGGEDLTGKALVMNVVINRIRDKEFPDTVEEVIFQQGQFSPISDGRYYDMIPDQDCEKALYMVVNGWDESQGATYFRTNVHESTWHSEALQKLFTHGNHTFFKE